MSKDLSEENKKVKVKIYRSNYNKNESPYYDEFEVPVNRWTTVLDALLNVKSYSDSSIGIRYSCRMASCGSCGMKINGRPSLACYTKISELNKDVIVCEPLSNFPRIRDLVTDFSQFFDNHKKVEPYIHNDKVSLDIKDKDDLVEFEQSPKEVDDYLQFSYCIKCGLCYSACPTVATDSSFPGPQALSQAYRYVADNRDNDRSTRLNIIDERHGIWRCHFAGSCSVVCPKGVDPALGIQLLKGHMLGFSKNDKKVANLRAKNNE
ncbi:MAG: succinate dehydrogenase iron-sulfur subunit [Thermoproteota archaeon]|nr:succinate dehydrogenase iron-sulfur subunit [Thermoproteota archaeon]